MKRTMRIKRKTSETEIDLHLNLDGRGRADIDTGIGFLDHMLTLFAKHGLFDLAVKAKGDLHVDAHHTNEDVGICLGKAFNKALKDRAGIRRFGVGYVVMEEALARVVLDISGRYNLTFPVDIKNLGKKAEGYGLNDTKHFLQALGREAGISVNVLVESGNDTHHMIEAVFKALARALDEATGIDTRIKGVPSTKGKL